MIPQDKNQPGPAGVVKMFGHPWHGLVEDGTLTLPNAATMPYPAPTAAGEADVLAFVVPGTPPVTRSTEQAAADAAAGRQWLDYALISGRSPRRLYGKTLGGNASWLYAAPDGSRWRVTLTDGFATHDLTSAWNATITCARFGEFGGTAETHDLAATLADWQQDIPGHAGGDYALDGYGTVITATVSVDDVRRDGARAMLCISLNLPASGWGAGIATLTGNDPLIRLPIGFIEVALSGTPGVDGAASLSVRHSRAQTLGTATGSESDDYQTWYHNGNDASPSWGTWSTTQDASTDMDARVGSYSASGGWSGRILAAGYDASGAAQTITLNTTYSAAASAPMPPDGTTSLERTVTLSASGAVTLSGPAGSVSLALAEEASSVETYDTETGLTSAESYSLIVGPESYSSSGVSNLPGTPLLHMSDISTVIFGLQRPVDGAELFLFDLATFNDPPRRIYGGVARYGATCLELILARYDAVGNVYDMWHHLGAVSMGGADVGLISQATQHPYGSAHPVTGDIARVRDVPVCWV